MAIQKLASVELRVRDVEEALEFDLGVFGLHELSRERDRIYLSCSSGRTCDLILSNGGTGVQSFAFSVDSEEDLEFYARRLEDVGVRTEVRHDVLPAQTVALRFSLPSGHAMELTPRPDLPLYPHPAQPGTLPRRGVAPTDVDHITIAVADSTTMRATVRMLQEGLGFRASDIIEVGSGESVGAWTRVDEYHHDLGLLRCRAADTLHHLAWTMESFDHLKTAADHLARAGLTLETGPGRHGVGGNLYAYFWTPGGNRYELSAEMPRLVGARNEPYVRSTASFNAFSAWGAPRPESFSKGS
jgi:catechol 2,3-dioxygenase